MGEMRDAEFSDADFSNADFSNDLPVREIVEQLRSLEERLRDLAYDRLREAVEAGEEKAPLEQRSLEQARRAVARALNALASEDA